MIQLGMIRCGTSLPLVDKYCSSSALSLCANRSDSQQKRPKTPEGILGRKLRGTT